MAVQKLARSNIITRCTNNVDKETDDRLRKQLGLMKHEINFQLRVISFCQKFLALTMYRMEDAGNVPSNDSVKSPFDACLALLILVAIALPGKNVFAQTCGQGSCHITIGGTQVTPFQSVCPNTTITYGLSGSPMSMPSWSISPPSAGSFANGNSNGSSVTVTWLGNGVLRVDYPDMQGSQCEEVNYSVETHDAGFISGPTATCLGNDVTLTLTNSQNAGGLVWQQCTSACTTQSNWVSATGTNTGSSFIVNGLATTTSYRTKLVWTTCGGGTDYSNESTVTVNSGTALHIVINDPGPLCGQDAAGLIFQLIEGSSNVGSNPTYEWLRNGGNDGNPQGPGDTNPDIKIYDPYDGTYGFQIGETVQLKVTSGNSCDSNNPALSNLVTITEAEETFPTLNNIQFSPDPICSGGNVVFTLSTTSGGGISGNWTLGPGGYASSGSQYILAADDIAGMADANERVVHFSGSVSGSCGTQQSVTASTSVLTVFQSRNPTVTLSNLSVCSDDSSPVTAIPNDIGTFNVHYDWYVNGLQASGNNSSSLSQSDLNSGDDIRVLMTVENAVCAPSSNEASGQFILNPIVPIEVVINDPGAVCDNEQMRGLVFQLDESASTLGADPTFKWLRNGVFKLDEPYGPGDMNPDPKIYDPYDETYGFQVDETVQLIVESHSLCARPATQQSIIVTIKRETETFPTFAGINTITDPICAGTEAIFTATTSAGIISGDWWVGSGGFASTTNEYRINAENVNGMEVHFTGSVVGSCNNSQQISDQTSPIMVYPRPAALANDDQVCSGGNTSIFISSDIPGTTFTWTTLHDNVSEPESTGSGSVIDEVLTLISPAAGSATFTITPTSPEGCVGDTRDAIASVTPNPVNPILTIPPFCDFEVLTLFGATSENITDYQWFETAGSFIGQTPSQPVKVMPAGSYAYKYKAIDKLGCISEAYSDVTINVVSACDDKMNWIENISYNPLSPGTNEIVADSRSYFDVTGRLVQSQVKKQQTGQIWLTHVIQDELGRDVISTLSAPSEGTAFQYKHWFVTDADGNLYDHTKFDQPVGISQQGTLGWYYSSSNTLEDHVPSSQFPYSRVDYYSDGTGEVRKSTLPGEQHRLGQGHEMVSGSFPVFAELDDYLSRRNTVLGISMPAQSLSKQAVQSIVRDQNGKYSVGISDKSGKSLMNFRPGTQENQVISITNSVISSGDITSANYRPLTYFYILGDQPVSISGSTDFVAENILTGERKNPGGTFADSNGNWPAGFYRIILNNSASEVTIGYNNYLLDVSCQFYDDAGRLKVSVSLNGYKSWMTGTDYALIDKTTYEYNHQGWLLTMTEPDAGQTQFVYRKDGKIRFSQNAQQAEMNRFSYTHYDAIGRPIESGEYVGTTIAFVPMSSPLFPSSAMRTELEKIYDQIDWSGSDKKDWIRTHYDIPDETIATLPSGFQQAFVRGAVSWTENINIKTWYSYDEFGRVTWMAQKPAALDRVFVTRYTYDFIGNVLEVMNASCLSGILMSPFYHKYEYDADNRLSKVYTSVDGTNQKLRATYEYYLHGPLKRIELGDKIQGIDFVYNIQGWLTQINHPNGGINDPGGDGQAGVHSQVKADVFGLILDYYESSLQGVFQTSGVLDINQPNLFHRIPDLGANEDRAMASQKVPLLFFKDDLRKNLEEIRKVIPKQEEKNVTVKDEARKIG